MHGCDPETDAEEVWGVDIRALDSNHRNDIFGGLRECVPSVPVVLDPKPNVQQAGRDTDKDSDAEEVCGLGICA